MSFKDKRRQQKLQIILRREVRKVERQASVQKKYVRPAFSPLKPRESRIVDTPEMLRIHALPSVEEQRKFFHV